MSDRAKRDPWFATTRTCQCCHGSGKLPTGPRCPACFGTGRVDKRRKAER